MENKNTKKALKRGHLYFNTVTNRVERVSATEGANVTTVHHKAEIAVYAFNAFRLAEKSEVMAYLGR
jgi:hypothetical protein